MSAIALGYIRNPRADWAWFALLPLAAVVVALGFHHWLPYMAQASIAVWVTVPHHYATWIRTYGLDDDFARWRGRLVYGPLLLVPTVVLGAGFAPVTLAIVLMLWDHQHSVMQQYGFSRVYDFKAGTVTAGGSRRDFWLGVALYGNLLVVAPLWSELWIAQLFSWNLALAPESIRWIQTVSWGFLGVYAGFYTVSLALDLARGQRVNPMKYVFLGSSYGLWYYVSWQDSFLVYAVAHRIMHGVQYIAMVYWYLERKAEKTDRRPRFLGRLVWWRFLGLGILYALLFQLAIGADLGDFTFGLVSVLQADPAYGFSAERASGFYAATAINAAGACHYYLDSFIWKVSDTKTQDGL